MMQLKNFETEEQIEKLEDYYRRRKLVLIMDRMRTIETPVINPYYHKIQKRISRLNVKILVLQAYKKYKFGYN